MRLHEDKILFRQAVSAAARHFKIDPAIVEKDYYVTIFLDELSKRIPTLLFKGGTSLSKCHKVIHRFSEDIDLTLEQDPVTQGQKKNLKKMILDVCETLELTLLNEGSTKSRRDYNRYEIDYSPELPAIAIKPILLVETVFIVKAYPSEEKMVSSIIYDFLVFQHQENLAKEYGLLPFPIFVQTLDRTLIDKIFALCDYYLTDQITEHSRHIYDINKLIDHVVLDEDFRTLFHRVREDRKTGNSQCVSAQEKYNISQLLEEIVKKEVYKADYQNITEQVVYEQTPYDQAICGLQRLIQSGLFR